MGYYFGGFNFPAWFDSTAQVVVVVGCVAVAAWGFSLLFKKKG